MSSWVVEVGGVVEVVFAPVVMLSLLYGFAGSVGLAAGGVSFGDRLLGTLHWDIKDNTGVEVRLA